LEHPTIVPKQPFTFHSGLWTGPPQATAGPYAHPMCAGRTSVARLQNPYSWLPLQHVFPHVETRNQKNQIHVVVSMSTCRADWLLGLPLTIFRDMWLALSNAQPPLPHAATLTTFNKTDRVHLQVMIQHMTLSIILTVIAEW
jgi:hypothetical protein